MMTVEVYTKSPGNAFRKYKGVERIIFLKEQPFLKIVGKDEKIVRFIRTDIVEEVVCRENEKEDEE